MNWIKMHKSSKESCVLIRFKIRLKLRMTKTWKTKTHKTSMKKVKTKKQFKTAKLR